MPAPALGGQPGAGSRQRRGRRRRVIAEALEPKGGGTGVQSRRGPLMLARIHEDVDQGVAVFLGASQLMRVVAVAPHLPGTPQSPVDGLGNAHREPLGAGHQRSPRPRFHDQVQMVLLHRKLQHAKVPPTCHDRIAHHREQILPPERRQPPRDPHGEVHRMRPHVRRTSPVCHAPPLWIPGLPSRPLSSPSPGPRFRKRKLTQTPCHLEKANPSEETDQL